jgi:hypothetical protein
MKDEKQLILASAAGVRRGVKSALICFILLYSILEIRVTQIPHKHNNQPYLILLFCNRRSWWRKIHLTSKALSSRDGANSKWSKTLPYRIRTEFFSCSICRSPGYWNKSTFSLVFDLSKSGLLKYSTPCPSLSNNNEPRLRFTFLSPCWKTSRREGFRVHQRLKYHQRNCFLLFVEIWVTELNQQHNNQPYNILLLKNRRLWWQWRCMEQDEKCIATRFTARNSIYRTCLKCKCHLALGRFSLIWL